MKKFFSFILAFLIVASADAATYYVRADGTAANKAAATSDASAATAMSLTTHNGQTFAAGDRIGISDKGGVYPAGVARLTVVSSGADGTPIEYFGIGTPEIQGDGTYSLNITSKNYNTFTGINFTKRVVYAQACVGVVFNQCSIRDTASHGLANAGVTDITINNSVIAGNNVGYGITYLSTGGVVTIRNTAIFGNTSGGINVPASNTVDYDYNLIIGNGDALTSTVTGAGTKTDGGHNIVAYTPKVSSHRTNTAYFGITLDDRIYLSHFKDVAAYLPNGVHATFYIDTAGMTAQDESDIQFLHSLGHEIGLHSHSHSPMNATTAFTVTSTNASPTVDIDVPGGQIILGTTTPGNAVTLAWTGNKSITDLKSAVAGKGWTITNATNISDSLLLSSSADSAGAQAAPYAVQVDAAAPDYMFFYNEIDYPKSLLTTIIGESPTTFAYPFTTFDADMPAYLLGAGVAGARSGIQGARLLSSVNVYFLYAIQVSTVKGDGTEATIRKLANHFYTLAMEIGHAVSFYDHNASQFTAQQWGWLADELVRLGGVVTTQRDIIARIKGDHSTSDNITYTKTYTDVSNYRLTSESSAIDAGTTVSGITIDPDGQAVPYSSAPDIGLYEHHDTFVYGKGRLKSGTGMTTVTTP